MEFKDYKENIQANFVLTAYIEDDFGNERAVHVTANDFTGIAEQEHKLDHAINQAINEMFEELPEGDI